MNKYRKLIPIVAIILIALGVNLDKFGINLDQLAGEYVAQDSSTASGETSTKSSSNASHGSQGKKWSDTDPQINLWHVFEGEINRKGKPVGFHSRPGGKDPKNARLVSIKSVPNKAGVYTAMIEIRDDDHWKEKFSSFFPDKLNKRAVINIILHAFENSPAPNKQPWTGPSGTGYSVQGYTSSRGGINTAFPVYVKSQ
jgi:hypothetical protein